VILALGTTAPLGSVTVPLSDAVSCAHDVPQNTTPSAANASMVRLNFLIEFSTKTPEDFSFHSVTAYLPFAFLKR
jgi:hypothetical protein